MHSQCIVWYQFVVWMNVRKYIIHKMVYSTISSHRCLKLRQEICRLLLFILSMNSHWRLSISLILLYKYFSLYLVLCIFILWRLLWSRFMRRRRWKLVFGGLWVLVGFLVGRNNYMKYRWHRIRYKVKDIIT